MVIIKFDKEHVNIEVHDDCPNLKECEFDFDEPSGLSLFKSVLISLLIICSILLFVKFYYDI